MKYCENCHDLEKCEMYGGCWNPPAKEKPLSPSDETACSACAECGMQVRAGEYHPYAACLMFKGCGKAHTVRENLGYVREDSEFMDYLATSWNSQGRGHHIMGRWFPNVSGSFRDAIRCRIDSLPTRRSAPPTYSTL